MSISGFEYAQARMQARHGARPDEVDWRRLHASASLEHFLEASRKTGLRVWVADLHAGQDAHGIELALRGTLASYADEVASWLPPHWQPAVRWTRRLVELPRAGSPVPRREQWRALWPRATKSQRASLESLAGLLDRHRVRMRAASIDQDGWQFRSELAQELSRLFRRHPQEPVTPFCHLALGTLDVERLRGAVLRRALFFDVASEVSWV